MPQGEETQLKPVNLLLFLRFFIAGVADSYRMLFYRPGSRGIGTTGIATGCGVFILYPLLFRYADGQSTYDTVHLFMLAWWGMIGGAVLHQIGAVIRFRHNHRREIGRFWLGGIVEPLVVVPLVVFLRHAGHPGMSFWLGAAYACSTLEIWLIRARFIVDAGRVKDSITEGEMLRDRLG